jgi:hypothetical protein
MALAGAWCSHAGELLAEARDTELGAASLTRTASLALPTGDKSDRRHGCDTRDRTAPKKPKANRFTTCPPLWLYILASDS